MPTKLEKQNKKLHEKHQYKGMCNILFSSAAHIHTHTGHGSHQYPFYVFGKYGSVRCYTNKKHQTNEYGKMFHVIMCVVCKKAHMRERERLSVTV